MKLGSLFDGSGGFPLAGALCGIEPVWASEVEPYPIAVTRSRFPKMKHLGDISKINGAEIEPVDIITFGSPCQDLSVAGKRAGLKHEDNGDEETTRSGLFMEAVRIIKEMRDATNGEYPSFALWENVPGAFSSNKGEDFRIVLEELVKIVEPTAVMPAVPKSGWPYADSYRGDGWSLAYRVFDAQYWGVPQRRRRIHLVLDLRGQRAREVLFEREGLRGYFTEGRAPWKATARNAENCPGTADSAGAIGVIPINTMIATRHKQLGRGTGFGVGEAGEPQFTIPAGHEHAVAYAVKSVGPICMATQQGGAEIRTDDKAPTITAAAGMSGNNQPVVAYSFDSLASNSMKSKNPNSGCRQVEVAKCLDTTNPDPSKNQGGIAIVCKTWDARGNGDGDICNTITGDHNNRVTDYTSVVVALEGNGTRPSHSGNGYSEGDKMYTLNTIDRHAVAYASYWDGTQVAGTLTANNANGAQRMPDKENFNCVIEAVGVNGDIAGTLDASYFKGCGMRQGVERDVVAIDRAAYNQGQNALYEPQFYTDGTTSTLVAKGPSAVAYKDIHYIVRRLTPTECARLQGFADRWGDIEEKNDFTDAEYHFWLDVRNTHAAINGKVVKEYTKAQMLTWYNKLNTDSAEYKMWGNGIALPPALYCMQGIVEAVGV